MQFEKSQFNKAEIDGDLLEKIKAIYIEELEKMITDPQALFSKEELESVDEFALDKRKIPKNYKWFRELLIRVGQDFSLTPDQIDILQGEFLD